MKENLSILPKLRIGFKVFDKNHNVIEERPLQDAHSWVRNAYNTAVGFSTDPVTAGGTFGDGYVNYKTRAGNITTFITGTPDMSNGYNAGSGVTTYGILVGTGTDAVTHDDFALQTLITNGSSSGKMDYQAMETQSQTWVGGVITVIQGRYINNNSGDSITINEVGLVSANTVLMARDIVSPGVTINDTGQLLVTYTFTQDCSP